jgi:polyhydroxyalkanoate synthesis repressor PhaR
MCCIATQGGTHGCRESPLMQNPSSRDKKLLQRVIKKYPNRRLYDTDTSSYITLAEIKRLVMDSESFIVMDVKTGEDLTRSILLQIILEEEANGSPMFTAPVLANIIRFYGHAMQGMMGGYLEKNIQALMDLQAPMMQGVVANNPFQQMQEQMKKQTEQFLGSFGLKR